MSQEIRVGKRLFVGNLAWRTSWQDLKDAFRTCGNVVYANVLRDEEGRSKGWGIVEFEHPEEAVAAITSLNGTELGGRRLLVREDREDRDLKGDAPRAPRAPRAAGGRGAPSAGRGAGRGRGAPPAEGQTSGLQIVVQGIPWSYTWKELKDLFAEVQGVERADIAVGYDGRSRGFGTVRFTTAEAAQEAVEKYDKTELEGRSLAVFLDKFA